MRLAGFTFPVTPPRGITTPVDTTPLDPLKTGTLRLSRKDAAGRDFMSAASGIAAVGGAIWAVSDEYGELVRFDRIDAPGTLVPGVPPAKKKPDLEAVLRLPGTDASKGAMLLALASGSSDTRMRGVALDVDAVGRAVGAPRTIDLAPLYAALDTRLPMQPNIEGAVWREGAGGSELLLFHRGKMAGDVNKIFRLDGRAALDAVRAGRALPASALRGDIAIDLGMLGGERLGFADARALPDGRIVFIASAEGSDATGDGPIKGSVVGMLDAELKVTALRPMSGPARKVEGIERAREFDPASPEGRFVLVTDPDDPKRPTELLVVDLA